ncbi:MAG: thymidylate synthase [Pseudomonadota bacterium]|nr:thymidylate synthase [Pseudomonadota bacterium]
MHERRRAEHVARAARAGGPQPQLVLHRVPDSIDDFTYADFEITGYEAQPNIPAPIAV